MIFKATRGSGLGDIALDDIKFFESTNCSILPSKANPSLLTTTQQPTTTTKTTTLSTYSWSSQDPVDCNFEQDFCLWQNDTSSNIFWKRSKGSLTNFFGSGIFCFAYKLTNLEFYFFNFKGPATDHTTQTKEGFFIFLDVKTNLV